MWLVYAFLSAVTAALVAIFAKLGLKEVDTILATTLRAVIMGAFFILVSLGLGKFAGFGASTILLKDWFLILLSALAGALSWLFFYQALSVGPTVAVTVIDKLSVVFTAVLAIIVLAEGITFQAGIGLILVFLGTLLVSVPWEKIQKLFS